MYYFYACMLSSPLRENFAKFKNYIGFTMENNIEVP